MHPTPHPIPHSEVKEQAMQEYEEKNKGRAAEGKAVSLFHLCFVFGRATRFEWVEGRDRLTQ